MAASTAVRYKRSDLTRAIRYAEDNVFGTEQTRQSAESAFVRAVEAVGVARVSVSEARGALVSFEASLCPDCGCHKEDHANAEEEDARTGWVCYDCGRDEECSR